MLVHLWLFFVVVALLFEVTTSQRLALVKGVATFNGTNQTSLNASYTVVTPHVYYASTALSLISLSRSNTSEPFTNFQSFITVV